MRGEIHALRGFVSCLILFSRVVVAHTGRSYMNSSGVEYCNLRRR